MFKVPKEDLIKRLKSLAWRVGMLSIVALVDFGLANLDILDLSPQVVGFLGLVLGEVSKQLNKKK